MNRLIKPNSKLYSLLSVVAVALLFVLVLHQSALAKIEGISGSAFHFVAKSGFITTGDGNRVLIWGFANGQDGTVQYPGPTLILEEGQEVTITLTNELDEPVSIVFPGQVRVTATGGKVGLLTREAPPGGTVVYHFTAEHPGTFLYHSGSNPSLQVEMGLLGAIIVRPKMGDNYAYNSEETKFDREHLFLLSDMDVRIHERVAFGLKDTVDNTTFFPTYWFINGRNAPDTMSPAFASWLPTQPYNCLPRMHPGEKMLMRVIGAGRDLHPYHFHGNNAYVIARDGRLLESAPGKGPDMKVSMFTIPAAPGQTVDAIFEWTGANLGWDIYGHAKSDPMEPNEYAPDHGKPFPVTIPGPDDIAYGDFYSGSPFLGNSEPVPPGIPRLNQNGGFFYMWHSHNEKEMVNYGIFPGGIMTMMIIEHPSVPIE